jgi:hypothetical protein
VARHPGPAGRGERAGGAHGRDRHGAPGRPAIEVDEVAPHPAPARPRVVVRSSAGRCARTSASRRCSTPRPVGTRVTRATSAVP